MTRIPSFLRILRSAAFASAMIVCFLSVGSAGPTGRAVSSPQVPDVLVLALCGTGPTDQVSINYSAVVPAKQAMADIKAIERDTGWFVGGEKVTTTTVLAGGGPKTTSGCFTTLSIIDYKEGTLPLEPFVNALKRFRTVEVNFLTPKRFRFKGLQEFENELVKIELVSAPGQSGISTAGPPMGAGGGSYLYRVRIKSGDVGHITLPKHQLIEKPSKQYGLSGGARVVLIIAIAAASAAAAYLIAYEICRRRRPAQGA